MTASFERDAIRLAGDCPVEDAEPLLALMLEHPAARVDLSACGKLHTAVFQLLLAYRPQLTGAPRDTFARERLYPLISVSLSEAEPTL